MLKIQNLCPPRIIFVPFVRYEGVMRYFYVFFMFLAACAKQGAPTGGVKDTRPPGIDSTRSSRNFATNFTGKTLQVTFDEWVTLSDVATQVLVSPPLATKPTPQVTLRGKTVTVEFPEDEILQPNTTYTINFGNAVKDLHEGNPAANLRYVFSTGAYIDSLKVQGVVKNAFTNEGVENITVVLYEKNTDSVLRQQKPFYFAKTNKGGEYLIENVRQGTFKMAAIEDVSNNLKWEEGSERIAFPDSLLRVADSLTRAPVLRLFQGKGLPRRADADARRYGLVRLRYNTFPDSLVIGHSGPEGLRILQERSLDTMLVWYDLPTATAWELYAGRDTVKVKALEKSAFTEKYKLIFADDAPPATAGGKFTRNRITETEAETEKPAKVPPKVIQQSPARRTSLDFSSPIATVDTAKWLLEVDSVARRAFSVTPDSATNRRLHLQYNWPPGGTATLTLLPGAVTDFYGVANADTLRRTIAIFNAKQLGGLNLTLDSLQINMPYVLRLMEGESAVEEERRFVANATSMRFPFANLRTLTYSVQLIEDRNNNGQWDTGHYYKHLQPERVFIRKLEALRPNWEIETTVEASYIAAQKKFREKK
jgi:hypothetical protein